MVNHSERAHSPWGASSAYRWMVCPASIKLSEGIENESSKFAAEGTCAHELAERALIEGRRCEEYIGEIVEGHTIDSEMADYVQLYVDYVNSAGDGDFKDTIIEERFDLSSVAEGLFGTNDACISEFMGTLEIIDLKYGKGIEISPEENKQLLYYALGASKGGEYSNIKLTIVQPRVENPIKSWTCSPSRLEQFENELIYAVEATKSPSPRMYSGEHCKFCPAKAICPQLKREIQDSLRMDFSAPIVTGPASLPQPQSLASYELTAILNHSTMIKEWLDSVEKHAFHLLESGKEVNGFKLVAKRANRKIKDPKKVLAELGPQYGESLYTKKIIGIKEFEKLVGKETAKDFLVKESAGLTIAPESDKRPEVMNTTLQSFLENSVESDDDFNDLTF